MIAQGADEFLHRIKLAAHGTRTPFLEIPSCPARAFVMPEGVEGFLEREGSHGLEVVFEQFTKFGGLPDRKIARAFQETIAGALEKGLSFDHSPFTPRSLGFRNGQRLPPVRLRQPMAGPLGRSGQAG